MCMCVYEHITHTAAGLDCFYSRVLACRSHSKRGNEAEIKRKKANRPSRHRRGPSRGRGREKGLTFGVRWESMLCFSPTLSPPLSTHCLVLPPPVHFSPLSSSLLIVWASWCLSGPSLYVSVKRKNLSYHCPDNCLLVQKSLQALCSHDDDMVTLPGSSEPPAEIGYPFSSPPLTLHFPPSPSLPIPLPPLCSSFGSSPPIPSSLQAFEGVHA